MPTFVSRTPSKLCHSQLTKKIIKRNEKSAIDFTGIEEINVEDSGLKEVDSVEKAFMEKSIPSQKEKLREELITLIQNHSLCQQNFIKIKKKDGQCVSSKPEKKEKRHKINGHCETRSVEREKEFKGTTNIGRSGENRTYKSDDEVMNTYALSDMKYMNEDIFVDPKEFKNIKLFLFKSSPSWLNYNSFLHNEKRKEYYDNGDLATDFKSKGPSMLYDNCGNPVILISENNEDMKVFVFSYIRKGKDCKQTPVAVFDFQGNGIVFDTKGKVRLCYNQAEGTLHDTNIPLHWKWEVYDLLCQRRKELSLVYGDQLQNDIKRENISKQFSFTSHPPRTPGSIKGPSLKKIESVMLADRMPILEPPVKSKPVIKLKPIALKITNTVSLKIIDQSQIHLIFKCERIHFKIHLGVIVNGNDIKNIEDITSNILGKTELPGCFDAMYRLTGAGLSKTFSTIERASKIEEINSETRKAKIFGYPKEKVNAKILKKNKSFDEMNPIEDLINQ